MFSNMAAMRGSTSDTKEARDLGVIALSSFYMNYCSSFIAMGACDAEVAWIQTCCRAYSLVGAYPVLAAPPATPPAASTLEPDGVSDALMRHAMSELKKAEAIRLGRRGSMVVAMAREANKKPLPPPLSLPPSTDPCSPFAQSGEFFDEDNAVRRAWNAMFEADRRLRQANAFDAARVRSGGTAPTLQLPNSFVHNTDASYAFSLADESAAFTQCILHYADGEMDNADRAVFGDLKGELFMDNRKGAVRVAIEMLNQSMQALPSDRDHCPVPEPGAVSREQWKHCQYALTNFYPASALGANSFDVLLDRVRGQPYVLHRQVFFGTGTGAYGNMMTDRAKRGIRAAMEAYALKAYGAEVWNREQFRQRLPAAVVEQAYQYAYHIHPPARHTRVLTQDSADFVSRMLSAMNVKPSDPAQAQPGDAADVTSLLRTFPQELEKRVALLASLVYGAAMDMRKAHVAPAAGVL
jgi:hypothetical protein